MATQFDFSLWGEITDSELVGRVSADESCFRIAQFGCYFQHQILLRKCLTIKQYHSSRIAAKRLVGECVDDEVFQFMAQK